MRAPELQELAFVDAGEAVRRHFEAHNYRVARLLWWLFAGISFTALVAGLESGRRLVALTGGASLAALLVLLAVRRGERFRRSFPTLLFGLFCVESMAWILLADEPGLAIAYSTALVPVALLLFRWRTVEQLTVAAVATGAMALRWTALPPLADGEPRATLGGLVAVGVVAFLAAAIASSITVRQRQDFLLRWRLTAARERERLRMREELHDARAVQLAMLPQEPPAVAGLEVAAVCVPATEVGGDYYDYFSTAGGGLAVAIGDVAGHGMASGLVLAGVRSGLHLLADDVAVDPARVLGRLNAVVAGPGGQRLLMTLGLAHFDRAAARATWVSAGHPPPLRFAAASRDVESPSGGQLPLGTRLPLRPQPHERPLAAGDVWLLVSDGVLETRDARGRELGENALARSFRALALAEERAGAILDGLLAEISRFRGGAPQDDDLTLVVVRVSSA